MIDKEDPLKNITRSMTYTIPQLGDNVIKNAKLIRICKNVGCAKPVLSLKSILELER